MTVLALERAGQAVRSGSVAPRLPERSLRALLEDVPRAEIRGDATVSGLAYRTDDVEARTLFFCVRGAHADGHDFAPEAVRLGASALVVERNLELDVAQAVVPSVREAMGPVAASFYGRPADAMTLIGITGTNGKTTTTYLVEANLEAAGRRAGVIGTTGVRIAGRVVPFPRTTPEAPDLQRLFSDMAGEGVDAVAMEVSSHGLQQHRVGGLRFDVAAFTNLTQDHLDYHPSMEAYFEAKALLFTPAYASAVVLNVDNDAGRELARRARGALPTLTYGVADDADVRASDVATSADGIAFRVGDVAIRSQLRGRFNVENALAAFAIARTLGIEDPLAADAIASVRGVPGRVEPVDAGQDFLVLVDYAHTPDALANVLNTARGLGGRVLCVFGAGGDRDREKRPQMGRVASELSDVAIVTSDNPRSEEPQAIIDEVVAGAGSRRLGRATSW